MRNYLVVGGSSGIGKAIVQQLASKGQRVFATVNEGSIDETNQVSAHHLNVMEDHLDFSFLPESLDGLVYCPGSINLKPFHRIKPESFMEDYKLQVLGAIRTIQGVLPLLKNSEQSSIVLFSTVAVQSGFVFHSQVSSSKGALEGLTRALSAELAPTIRVNAIAPSLTQTPLAAKLLNSEAKVEANAQRHPMKRVGTAEDIAGMATFLLTESSSWITGQIMHVDGGMSSIKA